MLFFYRYHERKAAKHRRLAKHYYRMAKRHWFIYKQSAYWIGEDVSRRPSPEQRQRPTKAADVDSREGQKLSNGSFTTEA